MAKNYFKCECGSEEFIRSYNVWNERLKVEVSTDVRGEELWDVIELGKDKDHLCGYHCAMCGKEPEDLNDGL